MAESKGAAARRINDSIRYMQISVFSVGSALDSRRCDLVDERGTRSGRRQRGSGHAGLVRRRWAACRCGRDGLVAQRRERNATSGYRIRSSQRPSASPCAPSGPCRHCTARPSSTSPHISQHSWPTSTRWTTSASIRSCAATSGICWRTRNDVCCWPNTEPLAPMPRCSRQHRRVSSLLSTTEWLLARGRPAGTGSWISCGTWRAIAARLRARGDLAPISGGAGVSGLDDPAALAALAALVRASVNHERYASVSCRCCCWSAGVGCVQALDVSAQPLELHRPVDLQRADLQPVHLSHACRRVREHQPQLGQFVVTVAGAEPHGPANGSPQALELCTYVGQAAQRVGVARGSRRVYRSPDGDLLSTTVGGRHAGNDCLRSVR